MQAVKRHRRKQRSGAAAVEFAVTASLLFMFILAIFEFGRAFMVINLLGDAARVGAREGAVLSKTSSSITTDVQNRLSGEGVNNSTVTVEVNGATGDPSTASSGAAITVLVTVPMSSVTWTKANFISGNLAGQSTLEKP